MNDSICFQQQLLITLRSYTPPSLPLNGNFDQKNVLFKTFT